MPEDKDNVVEFKRKAEEQPSVDAEQAAKDEAKKEMMERLMEGGRQLRLQNQFEHILYYLSIFGGLVVLLVWVVLSLGYNS